MNRRGFTLIELMIVISIIAILALVLFPLYAKAREASRRVSCASNLEQIGMALNMYAQAYDGHYPRRNNDFLALYPYASSGDVFACPSDNGAPYQERFAPGLEGAPPPKKMYSSYVYKGGLTNDARADTHFAGESQAFHSNLVNVLYVGGHVKTLPAEGYKPVVAPPKQMPGPVAPVAPPPPPPPASPPSGSG